MKQDIIREKGYYISFVNTSSSGLFIGDTNTETALCIDGSFYILNGDHRKEYKKCKTLKKAKEYFSLNKKQISSWSEELE